MGANFHTACSTRDRESRWSIDTPRLGDREWRRNGTDTGVARSFVLRWLVRTFVIMAGIAVGLVLTSAPAQADSDPLKLGKTVDRTVTKVQQTTKMVAKQRPAARPTVQKRVVRQAAAAHVHRVVRVVRPTVRKVAPAPVVRQRIPAPQRKTAAAPVVRKVVKHTTDKGRQARSGEGRHTHHSTGRRQLTVPGVTVPQIELPTGVAVGPFRCPLCTFQRSRCRPSRFPPVRSVPGLVPDPRRLSSQPGDGHTVVRRPRTGRRRPPPTPALPAAAALRSHGRRDGSAAQPAA